MKALPKSKNYAPPPPLPVPTLNSGVVGVKKKSDCRVKILQPAIYENEKNGETLQQAILV